MSNAPLADRPCKGSQWADLFAAMGASARTRNSTVAIGNHERFVLVLKCRSNDAQAFRSYFDWPDTGFPEQVQTWFHVDLQGVRIVVLDSFGGRMAERAAFLDRALTGNPRRWSIVLMHPAPVGSRPGRVNPPEVRDQGGVLERFTIIKTARDVKNVREPPAATLHSRERLRDRQRPGQGQHPAVRGGCARRRVPPAGQRLPRGGDA